MSLRPGPGWLVFAVVLSGAGLAPAAVVLTGDTYTQNFDTLPIHNSSNVDYTWVDNVTLPGWYSNTTIITAAAGVPSGGTRLHSFGAAGSTERALGNYLGTLYWGARFLNNTGQMITAFELTYVAEQWRIATAGTQTMSFHYLVTDDLVAIDSGGWTSVTALSFTVPTQTVNQGLNGNDPDNRHERTATISGLTIMPGQYFWIRWYNPDNAGGDHVMSVDDLSMHFTLVKLPEPATATLVLAGAGLLLGRGRRKR